MNSARCVRIILVSAAVLCAVSAFGDDAAWPAITREMKPWTYWWWPGSAVDSTNITHELERFAAAGYGGVHIVPIYGPKNSTHRDIDYLSDEWLAMLRHAVREGERLDLGVDMTLGTGWCFGGPNIPREMSGMTLDPKTLKPKAGGPMVKRSAPGGEGFMLNPFYGDAMSHYLERFTEAFGKLGDVKPGAIYHDSYEYRSNFSPDLFAEFTKRRGYDLEPELKNLFVAKSEAGGTPASLLEERAAKVRCDYNETISDMMIENSMPKWIEWAHARGMKTRYQAHGSPANWLDLYALADIPETEMFHTDRDVLISKFASSAAHVTGKKLVSAETGTWLDEHFTETLGDMKKLVDQLFLSGVNHVYYHGACYSPDDAAWPGWLFYAATEMNSRNAIWRDLPALNAYIARCQSLLQAGEPDNDILLYWPIRDYWSHTKELAPMMTVHKREWFYDEEIGKTAKWLWENGYSFDYVSDRQLTNVVTECFRIHLKGASYNAILIPRCETMPAESLEHIWEIARHGAKVIFEGGFPKLAPGESSNPALKARFVAAKNAMPTNVLFNVAAGLKGGSLAAWPAQNPLKLAGIDLIGRSNPTSGDSSYFIVNATGTSFDGWFPLTKACSSVKIIDPWTGRSGYAEIKADTSNGPPTLVHEIHLQLEPNESLFLQFELSVTNRNATWFYRKNNSSHIALPGDWKIEFIAGGPEVPAAYTTNRLASWTERGGAAESFAGTARYSLTFDAPQRNAGTPARETSGETRTGVSALHWQLDLGEVHESARVKLNGRDLGTLIMPPYRVVVDDLKPTGNVLEVEVTNLSANRVRDLDRRKADWKVMKDINLVNLDYKPFDASDWPIRPSGLIGPVTLTPVAAEK